ncbi:MAG: InlB B-repeat-containing protein [Bacteroidales bacterium]
MINMMNRFTTNLLLLFIFLGANISLHGQQFHYYNADGEDITLLTSWSTNPDGTGDNPENFSTDSSYFHLYHAATLQSNLTIDGEDSRVIVGDSINNVELSLAPFAQLDAKVDLKRRGSLAILSDSYPEFGEFEDGSTVSFSFSGSKLIPYHDYYNLQIFGVNPVFDTGGGDVLIRGNLILSGTVNFPEARNNVEYNFVFNGDGDQEVITAGNVLRSFNMTFEKPSGRFSFGDNTIISADNIMAFKMDETAMLEDNGITIYAGNSVTIGGMGNYDFSGTLVLAGTQVGIVNGSGPGTQFLIHDGNNAPVVTSLHNILINASNTGGEFNFVGSPDNVFTITGEFRIDQQADGLVTFQENEVLIHGDLIIEEGFAGTMDDIKKLTILNEESEDQGMNISVPLSIDELEIFNNFLLTGHIHITSLLHLSNGSVLGSGNEGLIVLAHDAMLTGYDDQNFIETGLGFQINNTGENEIIFPLSAGGAYRPLNLSVSHEDAQAGLYIARLFTDNFPSFSLPGDLQQVYPDFFFQLSIGDNPNIADISVGVPYDNSIDDLSEDGVRVAYAATDSWLNMGGTIEDGFVYSDVFFDQTGYLALAKYQPSNTKEIISFRFENFDPVVEGVINEQEKTIDLLVPPETDITALIPTIDHTGISVSPESGVAQDFSSEVVYTVTAEDGSTADYNVTVEVEIPLFILSLESIPEEGGTVSGEGTFTEGEEVMVSAQPTGDYIFIHWLRNEAIVSNQPEFTYTMPASDITLTAIFELPPNEPPVVQNTLELQQTIEQANDLVLDISDIFSDPEQDELSIDVVSSQPEIVSARIDDNLLILKSLRRGESAITLSADDGYNDLVTTSFRILVYPKALEVASPPESILDTWDSGAPEYTYPAHMIFLQSQETDPGIDAPLLFAYHVPHDQYHQDDQDQIGFPYSLTRGTRISGLGNDGISMLNEGSERDLGGLLLALNTSGFTFIDQNLALGFTLENLSSNTGKVGIRLQYRSDIDHPFTDWIIDGEPVVYFFGDEEEEESMFEELIPFSPELATEMPYLQILFRYYYITGDPGPRPEVRLDDIHLSLLTSVVASAEDQITVFSNQNGIVVQQENPVPGVVQVLNLAGQQLFAKDLQDTNYQTISFLPDAGVYLVKIFNKEQRTVVRKILVR